MLQRLSAALLALLMVALSLAGPASAQRGDRDRDRGDRGDWELLGSQSVGFGADRDVIRVGRREGRFERIRLEVKDNDVEILDLKVVYMNGDTDDVRVRENIRAGSGTRPLDLRGGDRLIREIQLVYRARANFRGRAVVEVWGEKSNWELLGSQQVGFRVDRDVIRVGRREGRFDKIRLEVKDNDVEILDLKVVYLDGQADDIRVRENIRAGRGTRPLDLRGGDRFIREIQLAYRSRPNFQGRATVEVWGERSDRRGGPQFGRWEELGCQSVGFLPDRDVIRVGRQEGRFSAIQLRVSGNKVHIMDLKVVYERGPADDFQVRSEIRDGGETRPLDLRGERRAIRQVEIVYRAQPSFKGKARVCVFGRS